MRNQDAVLKRLWLLGPMVCCDADTETWTHTRFAKAVGRHVGVEYSGDHMGRIMLRLGLTVRRQWIRKSERRAGGNREEILARGVEENPPTSLL